MGLKSQEAVLRGRVWWDSAGPTYPRQVQGLLAYGIPTSQLIFGTVSSLLPLARLGYVGRKVE